MRMNSKAGNKKGLRDERGMALITALLLSMMLLTAGGALILTTAMSATNAYDSTAETQAYYAAEAGLQATLNVLRGNAAPLITYRAAVTPADSNKTNDPATTAATPYARLSKWLNYDPTYIDRVPLTVPYTPLNGSAYNVALSDPDNSALVSFTTSGTFDTGTSSKIIANGNINSNSSPKTTISFAGATAAGLNTTLSGATNLGTFTITTANGGATIATPTPFTLTVTQCGVHPAHH
jgi:hypothetical protein